MKSMNFRVLQKLVCDEINHAVIVDRRLEKCTQTAQIDFEEVAGSCC